MVDNPLWEICERVAEVQVLLHDQIECGKHTAADVVAKAQVVLSEAELSHLAHCREVQSIGSRLLKQIWMLSNCYRRNEK